MLAHAHGREGARYCRLLHDPALLGGAVPGIEHLGIKQHLLEPVDNAPGGAAERQPSSRPAAAAHPAVRR